MGKAKSPRKTKAQSQAEAIAAPLQTLLEQLQSSMGGLDALEGIEELEGLLEPKGELSIVNKRFTIDVDKIESLDDIKEVIKAMGMEIYWYSEECPKKFETLYKKGLLKEFTDENI